MYLTCENYQSIFDLSCDAILVLDRNSGAIIDVNEKVSDLFGYTPEQVKHAGLEKLSAGWFPYTLTGFMEHIRKGATGEPSFEWIARDSKGRAFWVEVNLREYVLNGDMVTLAFVRNIDGRKKTEQRLSLQYMITRALSETLQASEAMSMVLQSICQHVEWDHGEVWFVDPDASVLRLGGVWNDLPAQLSRFCALSSTMTFSKGSGLPGRVWAESRSIWITDLAKAPDFLRTAAAGRAGLRAAFGFPIVSSGDIAGTMTFFSKNIRPPDNDLLDMFHAIGNQIGDFINRKKAEENLRTYAAELERSNKELQQFAYVVSHDLQEPLRTISAFLELLRKKYRGRIDEKSDQYISFAVNGAHRMSELIRDLLAYSRTGTNAGQRGPVDMNVVFKNVLENIRTPMHEQEAVISSDPLPVVIGDQTHLLQLLQNLIGNALKFRHKDRRPQVHVSVQAGDGEWMFSVRDNGIGIEPHDHEKIFRVFERLHSRQEYPGTGVGLAICKKIVEQHGGKIWVTSEPEHGSVFFFTVPDRPVKS